jgi:hypothetical protein
MITPGAHFEFVIWAYAGVGVATLALVAWVFVRSRLARLTLANLERQAPSRGPETGA